MKTYKLMIAIIIVLTFTLCLGLTAFADANGIGGEAAATETSAVEIETDIYSDDITAPIEESITTPDKGTASNMPFFTGAVLAVLAFAGVAVFCKVKGNK